MEGPLNGDYWMATHHGESCHYVKCNFETLGLINVYILANFVKLSLATHTKFANKLRYKICVYDQARE